MSTLPILGDIDPLASGVRRGQLKRLSSDFALYGCSTVTLWLTSGEGFRLRSRMQTLAAAVDVGVLEIERVVQPLSEEVSVDLPWTFRNGGSIARLVLQTRGARAECGLLLRSADGDEITVVPAASPHRLYVGGLATPPQEATPEYSLSRYLQETI